jgi:hypothetical protein
MSCPHGEWHESDCEICNLQISREICKQLDEKDAEIARLREGLHRISLGSKDSGTSKASLGKEARAALAGIPARKS